MTKSPLISISALPKVIVPLLVKLPGPCKCNLFPPLPSNTPPVATVKSAISWVSSFKVTVLPLGMTTLSPSLGTPQPTHELAAPQFWASDFAGQVFAMALPANNTSSNIKTLKIVFIGSACLWLAADPAVRGDLK
ncbi:hypothetical protein [Rhodoferax sp.]|uniref:hypothetical protein n=1 Tax=Rhodoferax sp. TaxID=50421 RepID=UPI0025E3F19B|nr:hypothetical protein [Rhodoferax sp.]